MDSKFCGGAIAALVTLTLLMLPLAPASAAPLEPPAQAEAGLIAQLWQWLASLFGAEAAGGEEETSSAGTCTLIGGNRGCAIDPNGRH